MSKKEQTLPLEGFGIIAIGPYSDTHRISMMKHECSFKPIAVSRTDRVSANVTKFDDYEAFQKETLMRWRVYLLLALDRISDADRDLERAMKDRNFLFHKLFAVLKKGVVPDGLSDILTLLGTGQKEQVLAAMAVFGNGAKR